MFNTLRAVCCLCFFIGYSPMHANSYLRLLNEYWLTLTLRSITTISYINTE